MKKKKEFVVPGVLQVCQVMLEGNLLGMSQYDLQGVKTTSQETVDNTDFQTVDWD